jgi:hypothetical protein
MSPPKFWTVSCVEAAAPNVPSISGRVVGVAVKFHSKMDMRKTHPRDAFANTIAKSVRTERNSN